MPRDLTPFDPEELERFVERERDQDHLHEQTLELGRYAPATHCSMCGKPLEARPLCPVCGDVTDERAAA